MKKVVGFAKEEILFRFAMVAGKSDLLRKHGFLYISAVSVSLVEFNSCFCEISALFLWVLYSGVGISVSLPKRLNLSSGSVKLVWDIND